MDTIEGMIKFLSSYPIWAKLLILGNVVCIVCVMVFARQPAKDKPADQAADYILRIKGIVLFPPLQGAEVQVSAIVNGTEFVYPSLAGVEWLNVGPSMAGQTFKLPKAEKYELRFEMRKRSSPVGNVVRLVSQETITLVKQVSSTYNLHGFDPESRTRSASVSAEISYSFEPAI